MYEKQQKMIDTVCKDIQVCIDMVGKKDEAQRETYGFVPGMNNMDIQVKAMEEQIGTLREGIFQVLFTGGFSVGKSTLINALMRKEVLRASIVAETAVITKIIFQADEKVIVYKKEIDKKSGQRLTETYNIKDFFEKYRVDQKDADKFKDIDYVQLQQEQDGIGGSLVQLVDSPGTSNSETDTEMARSFADKANAIVYMLNALQPFTDEDKTYIKEHYAGKNLKNVFFVMNRYNQVAPDQRKILKEGTKERLLEVFTVDGRFDEELYQKRVFFVDAYGSLNTRVGRPTPTGYGDIMVDDATTGVPEFEEALGSFLTDDNRDKDALAAYVPKLCSVYATAKNKIAEELRKYDVEMTELEEKRDKLNKDTVYTEKILRGIEETCRLTAVELVAEIQRDYDVYVSAVEAGWDAHFGNPKVIKEIPFNTVDMIKLAISKDEEKKRERIRPIQEAIKAYVDSRQDILEESVGQTVQAKVLKLESSLKTYQDQLDALDIPVDMEDIMRSIISVISPDAADAPDMKVNVFQLILGIVGADPEIAANAFNGSQSNTQAVMYSVMTNVFEYIAWYVVSWPIGLAMLAGKAFQMIKGWRQGGSNGAGKLLEGLKPDIIFELRNGKSKFAMDMEKKVGGSFIRAGQMFSQGFCKELEGQKASYDDVIANLGDKTFSIEQERERTGKLLAEMVRRISDINEAAGGVSLTEAGVLEKAEIKFHCM